MGHHHSRVHRILHDPERQRINQEFRLAGLEAAQYVDTQIASAGITLRGEERSYFIHQYIIAHTAEPTVAGQSKAMLAKIEADVATKIAKEVGSCRNFAASILESLPPGNELRLQVEQELANLDAREKSLQLCKDENLDNYMELAKEGSVFVDQKVAAGDIRPLTSDEHTKLVNEYIELRAENPTVKTYAETMEASIDAKIEYNAHEAERYIAYKTHHERHKHQNSFLYNLFKVVAIGAVAVFAPPLVGTVAPMLTSLGMAGTLFGTGVACAGTDALIQGIGIATGQQKSFSVNEVLETGASVSLGSAAASAGIVPAAMTSAAGAAVTQAVECQIGTRDDLDPLAVVAQGASSIASSIVSQVITPPINSTLQENFPDVVNKVGEENVVLFTNGAAHATANSALQSIALNTPMSLEGFLVNALGSTLGAKVGAAVNEAFYKLNIHSLTESNLSESEPADKATEDKAPIGEMCIIDEPANVQLPTEQEMQEFYGMIKQTIERFNISSTVSASVSYESSTTPTNPELQSDFLTSDAGSDDIEVIPPVIVDASKIFPANEESFYGSLSGWQKAGLSIGIVIAAVALLPEEIGATLLFGLGRLGMALMPEVGALPEALAVDAMAGEAIAGTAVGAGAINFAGKLLSKMGLFSQRAKSADIMFSEQVAKNELTSTGAVEDEIIPDLGRSFRASSSVYAPNSELINYMNKLPIEDPAFDCSEIVDKLYRANNGLGSKLKITPRADMKRVKVPERGNDTIKPNAYAYHYVYQYEGYIYDPRVSNSAIPRGDYFKLVKTYNPSGFTLQEETSNQLGTQLRNIKP